MTNFSAQTVRKDSQAGFGDRISGCSRSNRFTCNASSVDDAPALIATHGREYLTREVHLGDEVNVNDVFPCLVKLKDLVRYV